MYVIIVTILVTVTTFKWNFSTIVIDVQLILQQVTATAAVVFILAGVRVPAHASDIMTRELTHPDPCTRLNAILRCISYIAMYFFHLNLREENFRSV